MRRNVVIIGAPLTYETPTFVSGVNIDVQNYYNFFTSPTGGAYYKNEIIYLENPSWAGLKQTLKGHPADHTTIVFSGHGAVGVNSQNTFLKINSSERVSLVDIAKNVYSPKLLIITDSCRSYVDEERWLGFGDLERAENKPMNFPSYLEFQKARRVFNNALKKASNGIQVLYSCSSGEESLITAGGSYYSKSLLASIRAWSLKVEAKSVLLGLGAHKLSSYVIKSFNKKQNPKTYRTTEEANFPFALRLGTELL